MKKRFTIELGIAIISILIAIGGVVVAVTTRMNHVSHLEIQTKELKLELDEMGRKTDAKFEKLSDKINQTREDIKYLKGKLNNN